MLEVQRMIDSHFLLRIYYDPCISLLCSSLSFASGLLALMMNQRHNLLALSQYWFKKSPNSNENYQLVIDNALEEKRFPILPTAIGVCFTGVVRCFCRVGRIEWC